MSKFLTELDVALLSDTENEGRGSWKLLSPLVYQSDLAGIIVVPTGFVTDYASVKRIPLVFDAFGDTAHKAAVVHDLLYSTGYLSRAVADAVLKEAMLLTGVPAWRAWPMWIMVRLFGGSHRKDGCI